MPDRLVTLRDVAELGRALHQGRRAEAGLALAAGSAALLCISDVIFLTEEGRLMPQTCFACRLSLSRLL
jgi:hypothetical protein